MERKFTIRRNQMDDDMRSDKLSLRYLLVYFDKFEEVRQPSDDVLTQKSDL